MYRICKQFEIHAAHVLSKHPGPCCYPHGHTYRIEITLASEELDHNNMICDFAWLGDIVEDELTEFDHSIMANSRDRNQVQAQSGNPRKVIFEDKDPTSEVLAQELFSRLTRRISSEKQADATDEINPYMKLEKVRIWETSTAWAEYQK